jgi:hypothetical protein
MWILHALGYEMPPQFKTRKEARIAMRDNIREDVKCSSLRLCQVNHSKDHKELKIGSSQGVHTYSEYWIEQSK